MSLLYYTEFWDQDEKPCMRCQRRGIPCEPPAGSASTGYGAARKTSTNNENADGANSISQGHALTGSQADRDPGHSPG